MILLMLLYTLDLRGGPGAPFSKVLKSYCTRKAVAKSQTL